ncbi:DUF2935 domain-containing protein [Acetobacterium sp. MES1]|uniref:DUF2935 domain-containing protein n=1 Tax=Acetobacterium sp. MES1 TaxID=1899015 RepID=UPI00257B0785|nr:DUF2935 domain-containing protein [Acetobacterium sp. MES1]
MKTETFKIFYKDGTSGTITIENKKLEQNGHFNIIEMTKKGKITFKNITGSMGIMENTYYKKTIIKLYKQGKEFIGEDGQTHISDAFLDIDKNGMLQAFLICLKDGCDWETKKANILRNILSCKMFTSTYPLMVDHIMREADLYLQMIKRLQNREVINMEMEAAQQEMFWNRIMAEHSKFIRGLLDPTEEELFNTANDFGREFDELTLASKAAMDRTIPLAQVTDASLKATEAIRNFKAQGTQGLIECKIKSIIIPLLGDHTLREANHYLRLLKIFEK